MQNHGLLVGDLNVPASTPALAAKMAKRSLISLASGDLHTAPGKAQTKKWAYVPVPCGIAPLSYFTCIWLGEGCICICEKNSAVHCACIARVFLVRKALSKRVIISRLPLQRRLGLQLDKNDQKQLSLM
jgi:hypothetical protein